GGVEPDPCPSGHLRADAVTRDQRHHVRHATTLSDEPCGPARRSTVAFRIEKGAPIVRRFLRRFLVASAVIALVGLTALPAQATTVNVADFSFSPQALTIAQGGTVSWHNNGPSVHTSTQNSPLSMWNTGNIAVNATSASVTLRAAGVYAYHCAIHTFMTGTVKVPIKVSPTSGTTSTT